MLVVFIILSSVLFLSLLAFSVLTRLVYKLRKCSGLSILLLGSALVGVWLLQRYLSSDPTYAEVFAWQNFIFTVAILILVIYLWLMTLIDRRIYKWDEISYGPAICALLMLPIYYFVGVIGPLMASLSNG